MCRYFYVMGNLLFYSEIWEEIWEVNVALAWKADQADDGLSIYVGTDDG
jgi:hypothetical protein